MDKILITYGAVTVALIAGLFSFLGLLIAKESKVSEFRQAWIDALRADIAKFASSASLLAQLQTFYDADKADLSWPEFFKLLQPALDAGSVAQTSILLRLNPSEDAPGSKALIEQIKNIRAKIKEEKYAEAKEMAYALESIAAPVLKREWDRVKSGEPFYLVSKWLTGILVLLSILAATWFSVKLQPPSQPNPPAGHSSAPTTAPRTS